jgi:GntR family transcriptional regulator/MocR family aminotransferase
MPSDTNLQEGFPADLLVELDGDGGRGSRQRLESALRAAIQAERLMPGTRLPPTRTLAAELGISRSAVVAAYGNLTHDGYLEATVGSGTRVSERLGRAPEEPGPRPEVALNPVAAPRTPPLTRLSGGLPDPALFPRERWLRAYRNAVKELPDTDFTYPHVQGSEALRIALAGYLGRVRGLATSPEQLLVCTGYTQGVALLCRALRRSGARRVAVEEPCFWPHRRVVENCGLEPVPVPVDEHGMDVEQLARHDDLAAALVSPAHCYPTGATMSASRRAGILEWARSRDALVIEDDYDAEFRFDRTPISSLQGMEPDRVAYIGGVSKTLSPVFRLGWISLPDRLLRPVAREKWFEDLGSPLLEQVALAGFIDSGEFTRHLRRVRPIYRDRRNAAIRAVSELLPDAAWSGEDAGLHLMVTVPGLDERAAAEAAADAGFALETGGRHWANPEAADPSIVLGYGAVPEPTLRRGLAWLARYRVGRSDAPGRGQGALPVGPGESSPR